MARSRSGRTRGRADGRAAGPKRGRASGKGSAGKRPDDRTIGRSDHRRARPSGQDGAARVLVERRAGVATLTLNRPDKRNALDRRTVGELRAAIESCDLAADVRVVVLRGAGNDFCAGGDLAELLASVEASAEQNERHALEIGELFLQLRALPKLTVAVVQGRALAGGAGLALACDLVVARADAALGFPEILRGFVPAMVTALLRRMVGEKVAFDLAATGRTVDAKEAERLGLVSRVVPARGFEGRVTKLITSLAASPPSALALLKQEFHRLDGMGFAEGVRLGAKVNAVARATPDFAKGVAAFLRK